MRVIINADDFGYDPDTVSATINCFGCNTLTSASIMPNMPATTEALTFASRHSQFSFGVHLTYAANTTERPLCDPFTLPSLTTKTGYFLPAGRVRLAAICGRISLEEVERETTAQLALVHDYGIRISHVDSHCHLHKFGVFQRALCEVLGRFGIRRVRAVQNVYVRSPWRRPTFWFSSFSGKRLRRSFVTTDYMFMSRKHGDDGWWKGINDMLSSEGDLEVGVHPGSIEHWRRQQARGAAEFATLCRQSGVPLITWNEVDRVPPSEPRR
jgi:hypothetical protein